MLDRIRGKSQSVVTYVIFGLIIVSFVFLGVGRFGGSSSSAIATVNGEEVLVQEFYQEAMRVCQAEARNRPELATNAEMKEQLKRQLLDQAIYDVLLQQEAKRLNVFVSPQEFFQIVSSISLFQDEKGQFDQERYKKAVADLGMTLAKFEANLKNDVLANKVLAGIGMSVSTSEAEAKSFFQFKLEQRVAEYVLFAKKDYLGKAEVTDADMKAYYESNTSRFQEPARMNLEFVAVTPKLLAPGFTVSPEDVKAYYEAHSSEFAQPEQYKVRHILIMAPAAEASDDASRREATQAEDKLKGIVAEIKAGADFADLAKKHSQDSGSAPAGGDLGWLAKGDPIVPEFESAALALTPGAMSDIVRTQFGFHIIKMDDKKAAGVKDFADVKEDIKARLAEEKALKEEEVIRKAVVEDLNNATPLADIAKRYALKVETTGEIEKEAITKQLMLHSDAMAVIENVPVGEVAPIPVNITDGFALIKVLASAPARLLTLEEVKDTVRSTVAEDKASLLARKAAEEALPGFTGTTVPAAFNGKVQESTPFSRAVPFVMPFGIVPALSDALNGMHPGPWASRTFDVQDGTIIARVKEVIPASEDDWKKQGDMVYRALVQGNQNDAVQMFMRRLVSAGKIEVNEALLEQVELK